ncbi:hypothetical protein NMG60_11008492 [Bertholletia excelsa]
MSEQQQDTEAPQAPQPKSRPVGGTEYSWCRAVPGGTGITVAVLLLSKPPDFPLLQNALHKLQISYPILRSRLRFDTAANTFSFVTPLSPHLQIQLFDQNKTAEILQSLPNPTSPFHQIVEHELNQNSWCDFDSSLNPEFDLLFSSVYNLGGGEWVLALRLHTTACDRVAATALVRELVEREWGEEGNLERETEVGLAIEGCIPSGKANKPFWARGMDMLGYSLNAFRLANLDFVDTVSPRSSRVLRLQMDSGETDRLLNGCKLRGIGLCGVLAAAGLIAARSSKCLPDDQWEKYGVITLIDCRQILDPVLGSQNIGFYHSAILNTHDMRGSENLWDLAERTYSSFANSKKNNKHFSDMADLNFLMCRAIENPGLTPSSSLRTSLISVFEEPVTDHFSKTHGEIIGLQDYIVCGSVHGVGPSMSVFDTFRDGKLDCIFVYPSPLHSREQMQKVVDEMNRILVEAISCPEIEK